MGVIGITDARQAHDDVVRDTMRWNGKSVPGGCAGFVVGECDVVCHECVEEDEAEEADMIMGWSEWDYPGYTCDDCGRWLDVTLLVYDRGPGSELAAGDYEEI